MFMYMPMEKLQNRHFKMLHLIKSCVYYIQFYMCSALAVDKLTNIADRSTLYWQQQGRQIALRMKNLWSTRTNITPVCILSIKLRDHLGILFHTSNHVFLTLCQSGKFC